MTEHPEPCAERARGFPLSVTLGNLAGARVEMADRMYGEGLSGAKVRRAIAEATDGALRQLWNGVVSDATGGSAVALAAVGSLGRRDGGPCSDLDLVLLHDGTLSAQGLARLADGLWYPIWDSRLDLDHSVRSLTQCRKVASEDLPAALGLLDLRHVAGNRTLVDQAASALLTDWRSAARRRLSSLLESVAVRTERFGELAYLIEPDLKEARGGLRDAVSMAALAATWLTDRPHGEVDDAYEFLLDVRDLLQLTAGRASNRLLLVYQDDVAARLRRGDADDLLAALAQSGRLLAHSLDVTMRHARQALRHPRLVRPIIARGQRLAPKLRLVATGLAEHEGELVLTSDARPSHDALLPLRAAATSAETGLPIAPPSVASLAESPALPEPWSQEARGYLFDLLSSGESQISVWETLDLAGLVSRWIPEWGAIRNRPQRNAVHRFTVDRHLIQTVVEGNALLPSVPSAHVFLVACFLHDIGKLPGEGEHSEAGALLVPGILERVGVGPEFIHEVQLLVRHHLLLVESATKKDPQDPGTADVLLEALEYRPDLLRMLRALTQADAIAAGPAAWTRWRETLVDQLYRRCIELLN